jgi:hypothetical protein
MTQETTWFDQIFECAEGWRALVANRLPNPAPRTTARAPCNLCFPVRWRSCNLRPFDNIYTSSPPPTDLSGNTSTRGFDSLRPTQYLMAFQVRRTRTPVNVCGCRFPPSLVHARIGYLRMSACVYRCSREEFQSHNSHLHRYHRSPRVLSHPTSNAHHKDPPLAHPGRALPGFQHPNPARPPRHVEIQLLIPPPTPPGTPIPTPRPLSRRLPRVSNHNRLSSQNPYRIWTSTLSSCDVLETRSGLGNPSRSG